MSPKTLLAALTLTTLAACDGEAPLDREVPDRINAFDQRSADRQDRVITVVNATGGNIIGFFARPAGETSWGNDVFGLDWLQDAQSVEIRVDNGTGICAYDFLVQRYPAGEVIYSAQDVCNMRQDLVIN